MSISEKEFLFLFGWDGFFASQLPDHASRGLPSGRIICEEKFMPRTDVCWRDMGFDQRKDAICRFNSGCLSCRWRLGFGGSPRSVAQHKMSHSAFMSAQKPYSSEGSRIECRDANSFDQRGLCFCIPSKEVINVEIRS